MLCRFSWICDALNLDPTFQKHLVVPLRAAWQSKRCTNGHCNGNQMNGLTIPFSLHTFVSFLHLSQQQNIERDQTGTKASIPI